MSEALVHREMEDGRCKMEDVRCKMDDVRWMMVHSRMAPYGASKDGNGFSRSLGLSHSLFPLCTAPSGLLFSAKLASPHGSPNTAEAIYEDFCMAAFPFIYDPRRKWVFHGKIMVNCLVCRS